MDKFGNISVVLHKPLDIRFENRPLPAGIKPHEVLIQMKRVGICGSDVHFWQRGAIGDFIVKEPMVLGHESSGVVYQVGSAVMHLKPGDRVAIEPGVPCRLCEFCKTGRYNLCEKSEFCATPPHDGSLCQYYKHAADFCYKLPDNVTLEEGALMEPLAVAVHACRRAGITAGDSVLVLGAGPIGLVNMLTAKVMGASRVCITDISADRLKVAKSMGVDDTFLVENNDVQSILNKLGKSGCIPNKTIECTGVESSIVLGLKATKPGGKMLLVGMGKPQASIPLLEAAIKEVDISGVFRYANCYPIALNLISSGQVNVKPLITHTYQLQKSIDAFEMAKSGAGIKVMIHCDE